MAVYLISVTLNTANLQDQIQFYKAIGFNMKRVQIEKGGEVYRAHLNDDKNSFEINLFGMGERQDSSIPSVQFCFTVSSVDEVFSAIKKIPSVTSILDPTNMLEGRKAVVNDPDGNSVEFLQYR
jgi:predicted enzyme related to lactoylglutathione lyase